MTSLNPVLKVGEQIAEAVVLHQGVSQEKAWAKAVDLLRKVGIPHPEERVQRLPAPVLRRHAPARDDRDRALLRARRPDRRRADHGPRRHHPGPDPGADEGPPARIPHGHRAHHAQHRRRRRDGRRRRRHVRRPPVEHAPVGDLFKNPSTPYTKGLLGSVPSIYTRKERLEAIPGQPPDLSGGFVGCPFAPRCPRRWSAARPTIPPSSISRAGACPTAG